MASFFKRILSRPIPSLFALPSVALFNNLSTPELSESISTMGFNEIKPNDEHTESIMHGIRSIDPSDTTNTINTNACQFIANYYAKKFMHISDRSTDENALNDMRKGYNLITNVITTSDDPNEIKQALISKTNFAMCLHDGSTFDSTMEIILKHQIQSPLLEAGL